MKFKYSKHWIKKKRFRRDISDDMIEYAIISSNIFKDKHWSDALNAIVRIPPSGRILKVVYRRVGKDNYKIILHFGLIKMETWYDKGEDVYNIQLKKDDYWKSVELPNGVIIDVAKDGSVLSIEILNASKVFSGDVSKVIEVATKSVS